MIPPPPSSTLFPYTTLFRSQPERHSGLRALLPRSGGGGDAHLSRLPPAQPVNESTHTLKTADGLHLFVRRWQDRKSTRLNSSHLGISYAVFCLKKKKKNEKH